MKKLTTNQWLIGGGIIALIYVLYKKTKNPQGDVLADLQDDATEVIDKTKDVVADLKDDATKVIDKTKDVFKPVYSIPTGETRNPKKPYKRPIEKLTIDEVIEQVPQCEDLISKWKGTLLGKQWRTKADMEAERFAFLGYYCEKRYLATNRSDWEISNSLPILRQF
tara:strand:- start:1121 stop:1618 length:498 start_codon:yes stop_codon:yes gene_type:complete